MIARVEPPRSAAASGWASESLSRSLLAATVSAYLLWQCVVVATVAASPLDPGTRWPLLALCLATSLLAVGVWRGQVPILLWLAPAYAAVSWCWTRATGTDDALSFVTGWWWNLMALVPVFNLRGRRALVVAVAGAVVVVVPIALANPWGPRAAASAFGTAMAILVVGRVAASFLWRLSDELDADADLVAGELEQLAGVEASGRELAENSRILHDTVVNTLGAIAAGGAAVGDPDLVRQRCTADLAAVERLVRGAPGTDVERATTLVTVLTEPRVVPVVVDPDLDQVVAWEQQLAVEARHAVVGAVAELLRNVVKHAEATRAVVRLSADGGVWRLSVEDDGSGFDPAHGMGLGLGRSVVGRLRDVGLEATIDSRPGSGTRVVVAPARPGAGETPTTDWGERFGSRASLQQLERRSCWAWAGGIVGIGVVIEVVNRPGDLTATYAALLLVSVVVAGSWWSVRRGHALPGWMAVALVLATPGAYLLSYAGTDFGQTYVLSWQALVPTVPPAVLLVNSRGRWPIVAALVALMLTAAGTAALVWARSSGAGVVALAGSAIGTGVVVLWLAFVRQVDVVSAHVVAEQRLVVRTRADAAARRAAARARDRWQIGGLRWCTDVLRDLAAGRSAPADDLVRARCGREERHLRQLIMLSPDAFRMGEWFARALGRARERSVALVVRTGDCDAADDLTARHLGVIVLDAVQSVPEGSELVVNLLESERRTQLFLVGPSPHLAAAARTWRPPPGWRVDCSQPGRADLVEVREAASRVKDTKQPEGV